MFVDRLRPLYKGDMLQVMWPREVPIGLREQFLVLLGYPGVLLTDARLLVLCLCEAALPRRLMFIILKSVVEGKSRVRCIGLAS